MRRATRNAGALAARGLGAVALCLGVVAGCAMASPAPSARYAPGRETTTGVMQAEGAPAATSGTTTRGAGGAGSVPSSMSFGVEQSATDELTRWESALEHEREQLAAGLSECRDICRAAGNICVAAREICRLTGDPDGEPGRDARCQRARAACSVAERQRDGSCVVCPRPA